MKHVKVILKYTSPQNTYFLIVQMSAVKGQCGYLDASI